MYIRTVSCAVCDEECLVAKILHFLHDIRSLRQQQKHTTRDNIVAYIRLPALLTARNNQTYMQGSAFFSLLGWHRHSTPLHLRSGRARRSALSALHLRPSGVFGCCSSDLEFTARQFARSGTELWLLQTTAEDSTFLWSLAHSVHYRGVIDDALYKLLNWHWRRHWDSGGASDIDMKERRE